MPRRALNASLAHRRLASLARAGLIAAALASSFASPAVAQFSDETLAVQRALVDQGYDPGIVDGFYGPATASAITQLQSDWGVEQTGEITPEVVALLTEPTVATLKLERPEGEPDCAIISPTARPQEAATWTGACARGRPEGPGVLTWTYVRQGETKTETLEGVMAEGRVTGEAVFVAADGARYEGGWLDGKPHGTGKLTSAGGDTYEGGWKDGKPDGQGKWVSVYGESFEGAWVDGLPEHLQR